MAMTYFRPFTIPLFCLVGPNVTLTQSSFRSWSLMSHTADSIFFTRGNVSGSNPINLYDSNVVCLTFVPQSLLTFYGAINSNYYNIIRLSVL